MDKKTFLQFLLISAVILIGWNFVMLLWPTDEAPEGPVPEGNAPVERANEQAPAAQTAEKPATETRQQPTVSEQQQDVGVEEPVEETAEIEQATEEVHGLVLENEFIRASWTNKGAGLERLDLLDYRAPYFKEGTEERPVLTLVRDFQEGYYSDVIESVTFLDAQDDGMDRRETVGTGDVLYEVVHQSPETIVFEANLAPQLKVRKTVTLPADAHHCLINVEFINRSEEDLRFRWKLRGAAGVEREQLESRYSGATIGLLEGDDYELDRVHPKKLKDGPKLNESTNIAWVGMASQYFVALTKPTNPEWINAAVQKLVVDSDIRMAEGRWAEGRIAPDKENQREKLAKTNGTVIIHAGETILPRGGELNREWKFISAPILKEKLDQYGKGLTNAFRTGSMPWITSLLSLGTLGWLSPIMVSILEFFHNIVPNYGVAILLLTILVRGALHPLTRSSQMSMHKMKLLQPQIQELQNKFGDERQKVAQEQMKLYQKYGVHPLSGCWPMLLQMPVFISLFTALRTSVQLRQATFIPGWITDLSQPDTVWTMPFRIFIIGNQLNILPFLMAGMMFLNQQLTPSPSDPKAEGQQKIMKWFMLLFPIMLYHFASGLLLYITTSTATGALQSWIIRRQTRDMELKPVAREKSGDKKKKKTRTGGPPKKKGILGTIMEKLEEQQKKSEQAQSDKKK
jgi:YidC/Oxa1 family membrane protein insertase